MKYQKIKLQLKEKFYKTKKKKILFKKKNNFVCKIKPCVSKNNKKPEKYLNKLN